MNTFSSSQFQFIFPGTRKLMFYVKFGVHTDEKKLVLFSMQIKNIRIIPDCLRLHFMIAKVEPNECAMQTSTAVKSAWKQQHRLYEPSQCSLCHLLVQLHRMGGYYWQGHQLSSERKKGKVYQ